MSRRLRDPEGRSQIIDELSIGVVTDLSLWTEFAKERSPQQKDDPDAFETYMKTLESSPSWNMWDDLGKCERKKGRFRFRIDVVGGKPSLFRSGGFGTVVGGQTGLDPDPPRPPGVSPKPPPRVLKMSTATSVDLDKEQRPGIKEGKLGLILNETFLDGRVTPHVIRTEEYFVCNGVPPRQGVWAQVINRLLPSEPPKDEDDIDFLQEAQEQGLVYIVTERIRGIGGNVVTLHDLETSGTVLSSGTVRSLAFQILFTLGAMEEIGFVHRDIQTNNILMKLTSEPRRLYWTERSDGDGLRQHYDPMAEQQKDRVIDVKFIDFGLSATGTYETSYARVQIYYRPPEMMFVGGQEGPTVRFGPESDLFSAALVILALAWRSPLATMKHIPVYKPPELLVNDLRAALEEGELGNLRLAMAKQFPFLDSAEWVSLWLWNLVHVIGMPSNEQRAGIEQDLLYRLVEPYENLMHPVALRRGWVRSRFVLGLLGPSGQDDIVKMLSWDPKKRGRALDYIQTSTYFASVRANGAFLALDKKQTPGWGFREGSLTKAKIIDSSGPRRDLQPWW